MRDWKQAERRIAAILGGRRIPVSGRGRGDNPDIEHPALSVEVKARARASFPAWSICRMRRSVIFRPLRPSTLEASAGL